MEGPTLPHHSILHLSLLLLLILSQTYREFLTLASPAHMAGGGGKLVVMVAEKPSICNSIAHALCGGAETNTRGTSRGLGEVSFHEQIKI